MILSRNSSPIAKIPAVWEFSGWPHEQKEALLSCMVRSIKSVKPVKKRGPGRPATGRHPFVGLRIPFELTMKIDDWARANGIGRSEALRRLAERALACEAKRSDAGAGS
jgi:hypothetical protein